MKRWVSYAIVAVLFLACGLGTAVAQKEPRPGKVIVPPSNAVPQKYRGRRAHTNFLIFVPAAKKGGAQPAFTGTTPSGETPASLSCIYQTWAGNISGCPITPPSGSSYSAPSGGTHVIAIVDAYDYPTAASDFQTFSDKFGLPSGNECGANGNSPCFTKVLATNSKIRSNCSWAQEEALDIEWAHAMAPYAQIILVEAASNSNTNLMDAVQVATNLVAQAGGGEVSMSWGSSESSTQSTYDGYFIGKGVTYVASSGDTGGKVIWPSTSPNVVSAGGTTVNRSSSGAFTGETTWSDAGGGPSKYEFWPSYQSDISTLATLLQGFRGTPDLSFDANPSTGVSVYDSTSCQGYSGWMVFGGTSVAAPSLSGIFNLSGNFSGNNSIQTNLYQNYSSVSNGGNDTYTTPFYDVTFGTAGTYSASKDWDYATGIGSDRGLTGMTGSTSSVTVSSLSLSSASVVGGNPISGTVKLSAAAPSGGAVVTLTSSDTSVVTVPSSVTVAAGSTTGPSFTINTSAVSSSTPVTITASYDGSSANATLTVNAASSGGSFTISAVPSNGSGVVSRNSSITYSVTVTATSGFTGAVNLTVSGVPPQSSAIFTPTGSVNLSGSTSQSTGLAVTTGKHTPTKTYTLTITGTDSSGSIIQSTTVLLTVQ